MVGLQSLKCIDCKKKFLAAGGSKRCFECNLKRQKEMVKSYKDGLRKEGAMMETSYVVGMLITKYEYAKDSNKYKKPKEVEYRVYADKSPDGDSGDSITLCSGIPWEFEIGDKITVTLKPLGKWLVERLVEKSKTTKKGTKKFYYLSACAEDHNVYVESNKPFVGLKVGSKIKINIK